MSAAQTCDTAFKQAVLLECYDALEAVGFTRYRKYDVDWPMERGFHCWLGLNTGLKKDHLDINPFVGVHVVPIERLWNELKTGKYPGKYNRGYATYAVHIGLLAPKELIVRFDRQTDVAAEAARLARLCADVGLSYALSIGTYERLLPLLRERVPMLGAYPERVASCLYLMDRKDEARSFTETFLQDHREYFEGFSVPFLRMLDEASNREDH